MNDDTNSKLRAFREAFGRGAIRGDGLMYFEADAVQQLREVFAAIDAAQEANREEP